MNFVRFFSVEIYDTVIVRKSKRMFVHLIISVSSQDGVCPILKLGLVYVQFLL